jgi:hypothetical protein
VAPKVDGTRQGQYGGTTATAIRYKTTASADLAAAANLVYGKPATDALNDANHPLFQWAKTSFSGNNGPNSSGGIGGFTDWYIPAKNELAILYFFLKPDTTANSTSDGSNPNSVAPYTPSTNYGPGFPNQTSADGTNGTANFRFPSGAQNIPFNSASPAATNVYHWSTSDTGTSAWTQGFNTGDQITAFKSSQLLARAIRRVAV